MSGSKINLNKHGSVVLDLSGKTFVMTPREYDQLGQWIAAKQQEQAMRWWASQFSTPFETAVGIVNRLQIAQQYGGLPALACNLPVDLSASNLADAGPGRCA